MLATLGAMLFLLVGCLSTSPPQALQVLTWDGDDYSVRPRIVPELDDPYTLSGTLGTGYRGGFFDLNLLGSRELEYKGGQQMRIRYVTEDGIGVPLDEDGLTLWSYYNSLSEVRAALKDLDIEVDPVFPVPMAYQPIIAQEDFFSGENAAYVSGGAHTFILLPDLLSDVVPLAANPGVVRHEFGHAYFHFVLTGDPYSDDRPYSSAISALNEGFADMLATLTLDTSDFFSLSFPAPDRDVTGDAVASADMYLSDDPYALGTVYASLAWDLRLETEPEEALVRVIEALNAWADEEAWEQTDRFAEILVTRRVTEAPESRMCEHYARRFPDNAAPEGCP